MTPFLVLAGYVAMWCLTTYLFYRIDTDDYLHDSPGPILAGLFGLMWPLMFPVLVVGYGVRWLATRGAK